MGTVISLQAYKKLKECHKRCLGYQKKLMGMDNMELILELERYSEEFDKDSHSFMTVVKGRLLMRILKQKSLTNILKKYVASEEARIQNRQRWISEEI